MKIRIQDPQGILQCSKYILNMIYTGMTTQLWVIKCIHSWHEGVCVCLQLHYDHILHTMHWWRHVLQQWKRINTRKLDEFRWITLYIDSRWGARKLHHYRVMCAWCLYFALKQPTKNSREYQPRSNDTLWDTIWPGLGRQQYPVSVNKHLGSLQENSKQWPCSHKDTVWWQQQSPTPHTHTPPTPTTRHLPLCYHVKQTAIPKRPRKSPRKKEK